MVITVDYDCFTSREESTCTLAWFPEQILSRESIPILEGKDISHVHSSPISFANVSSRTILPLDKVRGGWSGFPDLTIDNCDAGGKILNFVNGARTWECARSLVAPAVLPPTPWEWKILKV